MDRVKDKWRDILLIALTISNIVLAFHAFKLNDFIYATNDKAEDALYEIHKLQEGREISAVLLNAHSSKIDDLETRVDELETRNMFKPFW